MGAADGDASAVLDGGGAAGRPAGRRPRVHLEPRSVPAADPGRRVVRRARDRDRHRDAQARRRQGLPVQRPRAGRAQTVEHLHDGLVKQLQTALHRTYAIARIFLLFRSTGNASIPRNQWGDGLVQIPSAAGAPLDAIGYEVLVDFQYGDYTVKPRHDSSPPLITRAGVRRLRDPGAEGDRHLASGRRLDPRPVAARLPLQDDAADPHRRAGRRGQPVRADAVGDRLRRLRHRHEREVAPFRRAERDAPAPRPLRDAEVQVRSPGGRPTPARS